MEEVNSLVIEAIVGVLGTAATWFLFWLRQEIRKKVQQDYLQGLLLRLSDAVEISVREAAQTTVPAIKEAAADRKISAAERAQLKRRAKDAAIDQLTKLDRDQLDKFFEREQLERKLDRQIEAAVQRLREERR